MENVRILVVEDELIVAKDIKNTLNDMGYNVCDIVTSGEEAIKKTNKLKPDLVLMDIVLGDEIDGVNAAKKIKDRFNIPIIYLTAYADDTILERAKITEPFGYIIKPFEENDLKSTIDIALYKHKIESKLKESEKKYRTLTENINVGIYRNTSGQEGKFIEANPAIIKMFGYKNKKEFLKLNVSELYQNPEDRKKFSKNMSRHGFAINEEIKLKRKDGTLLIASVSAVAVKDEKGEVKYFDGIIEDITQRKQLEKDKEKVQSLLFETQKMEAIRRLAGGVAHEFNNLLTGIMGFSDLLLYQIGNQPSLRKDIESIKKAAKKAASLSTQLLTFSLRYEVQMKVLDINNTISSIHRMVQNLLGENIKLIVLLDPALEKVNADSGLINQIIINLVTNAQDAMPEGGKLTISTENIILNEDECKSIPYSHPGKFVCLTLTDTGVGMDQDGIHRMFEPFFGTKEIGKGTGLGLSVVYGIVKQHEGWINVESKPGHGSTLKIYFPVTSEKPEEETRKTIKKEQFDGCGRRILVVEDEEIVRELASRVFRENGYIVLEASNSQEALAIFNKEKGEFHLVFSDVVMPGENGIQLVDKLLSQKPELKVLFSSGYADDKSQRAIIIEKGFQFLQKPYTPDELLQNVEQIIEKE